MSSHALLLRLFLAPGFFSVYRALQYIRNYSDNVGITHYLTHRLDHVPTDELAETWMLIWYLLLFLLERFKLTGMFQPFAGHAALPEYRFGDVRFAKGPGVDCARATCEPRLHVRLNLTERSSRLSASFKRR